MSVRPQRLRRGLHAPITALPMMQALMLMGIYMFLPLVVFLSGFDLRAMF